jgi:hypothetical protein
MENTISQQEINKEVHKYLLDVKKHLDEHYTSNAKNAIVKEIEAHLKEKVAVVEKQNSITTSLLNDILSDFGDASEIASGYVPSPANKEPNPSTKFLIWIEKVHVKLYPFTLEKEGILYMTILIWLCIAYLIIPNMLFPRDSINPGANAVFGQITIGYVILHTIFARQGSNKISKNTLPDRCAFTSQRAPVWQLLLFMVLFISVPLSQTNLGSNTGLIFLIIFIGQFIVFVLSDRRPIAIPHHLVVEAPVDHLNIKTLHQHKIFLTSNMIFKVIVIGGLCTQIWNALMYNVNPQHFYDPSSTEIASPLFYGALIITLIAYCATSLGFAEFIKIKALNGARIFGVMKIIVMVVLLFLGAIIILRQGWVFTGSNPWYSLSDQIISLANFSIFTWWAFRYTRLNVAVLEASIVAIKEDFTNKRAGIYIPCPKCSFLSSKTFKHCPECGFELRPVLALVSTNHLVACVACGEKVRDANAKFCPTCGKSINV